MTTSSGPRFVVICGLLGAVLVVTHGLYLLLPGLFAPLAGRTIDLLFQLRSRLASTSPEYDDTIVHIDIDDRSLHDIGTYYLDRRDHARLVRNLGRAGVAAQLHDIVFAAPQSESDDHELEQATHEAGNVYYGMGLGLAPSATARQAPEAVDEPALDRQRWKLTLRGDSSSILVPTRYFATYPQLATAARGMGFLDVEPDRDGVYRRAPLLARDGEGFFPSMPLLLACNYLGVAPDRIELQPGRAVTLHGARRPGAEEPTDIRIPIDRQGRLIVNYTGPWGSMKHYPFSSVYEASDDRFMMEDLRDELSGKIAVVSWVTTGVGDIGPVPTDPLFPLSGIHASVLNSILTGRFLSELSTLSMLLWIELPLLALLLLAATGLRTTFFLSSVALLIAGFCLLAALLFLHGELIVNVPRPLMLLVGGATLVAAYHYHVEARGRAVLRHTFDAYFPPSVVRKIMANPSRLDEAAQKKELTVMFTDIKSFTHHTSEMDAARVRVLLNEYFERMIEIVFRYEGTLDKFIGDGLMVFFGDPDEQPDHALRCVRAAVDMQREARELDGIWRARGDMPLEIRIGINTGPVVVGNMGSRRRLSYTVLGETVNLAQRLESSAPTGGILISERTHELLAGAVPDRRLEPIRVKGIDRPIAVFEIA